MKIEKCRLLVKHFIKIDSVHTENEYYCIIFSTLPDELFNCTPEHSYTLPVLKNIRMPSQNVQNTKHYRWVTLNAVSTSVKFEVEIQSIRLINKIALPIFQLHSNRPSRGMGD